MVSYESFCVTQTFYTKFFMDKADLAIAKSAAAKSHQDTNLASVLAQDMLKVLYLSTETRTLKTSYCR